MVRDELQERAVKSLEQNRRLICQWATGTGKSNVVLKFLERHPGMACLILVPEQDNIQNWEYEFDKFGIAMWNVTVVCYASLHKYEHTDWDLLVFDEAPHMDTVKRRNICKSVTGTYVLALGAVIDSDELSALELSYGKFAMSYVSLKNAIDWGILPSPKVNVWHITMDSTSKKHLHNGQRFTDMEMYRILQKHVDDAMSLYKFKPTAYNKIRMLRAGSERKLFLGKLKENAVRLICDYLEQHDKRFLCFCSSIQQAESLCMEHALTSHTPASANLLDKFNSHEIDSLFVVGKLIEGQNLVDIEHGIITQLGGTSRITVQSVGRIMRSKSPTIWIPIFDKTKDASFLYTLTSNVPSKYISHYNF